MKSKASSGYRGLVTFKWRVRTVKPNVVNSIEFNSRSRVEVSEVGAPAARKAEKVCLYKMLQSNGHPANFIKQATRPPRGTTTIRNQPENAPPSIWRSLSYIQGSSESVTRRLNPYNVKVAHKPH